ncbi:hypothetical protein B0T25DRAFT_609391 [Lasiosphaeria hispida]|uniref:Ankyrin n=1 Tax=Lasiosphaeria hispida TaxID=260671 RepID=A0AAJ0MBV4_9PEZI|nr:hypothetical protein B0T25DRAFT_609391 [Lasiosphaeria hispida]
MASIHSLPNELYIYILKMHVLSIPDLAAVAKTSRHLFLLANFCLYEAAARDTEASRLVLSTSAENGFIRPAELLLSFGGNANVEIFSPFFRSRLRDISAAQRRQFGRRPLVDKNFIAECQRSAIAYQPGWTTSVQEWTKTGHLYEIATASARPGPNAIRWTALHVAAHRGDNDMVNLLLRYGADMAAAAVGCCDCFPSFHFTKYGRLPDSDHMIPRTASHGAVCAGHLSTAYILLAREAPPPPSTVPAPSVNQPLARMTGPQQSSLHLAAWHGHLELCAFLVEQKGCDVNLARPVTPLVYAACGGHLQTVGRYLLDKGADWQNLMVDGRNHTILTFLLQAARWKDAHWVLDLGPNTASATTDDGLCPLQACIEAAPDNSTPLWDPFGSWTKMQDEIMAKRAQQKEALSAQKTLGPDWEFERCRMIRRLLATRIVKEGVVQFPTPTYPMVEIAVKRTLPATLKELLATTGVLPLQHSFVASCLNFAFEKIGASSASSVEILKLLLDSAPPGSNVPVALHQAFLGPNFTPTFAKPNEVRQRTAVVTFLHRRLVSQRQYISPKDWRDALIKACTPGFVDACKTLSALEPGILRHLWAKDLKNMLWQATPRPHSRGDVALVEWILASAAELGQKEWLLAQVDLHYLESSLSFRIGKLLLDHGARLDFPSRSDRASKINSRSDHRSLWGERPAWAANYHFSARTRQQMFIDNEHQYAAMLTICSRPHREGALELLQRMVEVLGENAGSLVNCASEKSWETFERVSCPTLATPACKLASASICEQNEQQASTQRAMMDILMNNGAEVHAIVSSETLDQPSNLNHDVDKIFRKAQEGEVFAAGHVPKSTNRWSHLPLALVWQSNPIMNAIDARNIGLVKLMFNARPLTTRNSNLGQYYLFRACGLSDEYYHSIPGGIPCPKILEAIFDLANLDNANFVNEFKHQNQMEVEIKLQTPLEVLLAKLIMASTPSASAPQHICHCEEEIRIGEDDLSKCIYALLKRGAMWTSILNAKARTRNDSLRSLRRLIGDMEENSGLKITNHYIYHNVAKLRKHIVLQWDRADIDALPPDFNPFEMGDIKATYGTKLEASEPMEGVEAADKILEELFPEPS